MSTKRPQNNCRSCGYTWYPRGKDLAIRCPKCGGVRVSKVSGFIYVAIVLFLYLISPSDKKSNVAYTDSVTPITPTETLNSSMQPLSQSSAVSGDAEKDRLDSESTKNAWSDASNVDDIEWVKIVPVYVKVAKTIFASGIDNESYVIEPGSVIKVNSLIDGMLAIQWNSRLSKVGVDELRGAVVIKKASLD